MSEAKTKLRGSRRDEMDPVKQAQAAAAIREALRQFGEDEDEQLVLDTVEGETNLFEALEEVLDRMRDAQITSAGCKAVMDTLKVRKERAEQTEERLRAIVEQALTIAGADAIPTPTATLVLGKAPPQILVTEEADIPARFWKPADPTLDKKALAEAVKAHADALAIEDPEARAKALAEAPPIPGAVLSNGAPRLSIRKR